MDIYNEIPYSLKMLKFHIPFIPHIKYSEDEKVQQKLKKYFSNEKLRKVFKSRRYHTP